MTYVLYDPENHEMGMADDLGSLQHIARELAHRNGAAWYSIDDAHTAQPWGRLIVHDRHNWTITSHDRSVTMGPGHTII